MTKLSRIYLSLPRIGPDELGRVPEAFATSRIAPGVGGGTFEQAS